MTASSSGGEIARGGECLSVAWPGPLGDSRSDNPFPSGRRPTTKFGDIPSAERGAEPPCWADRPRGGGGPRHRLRAACSLTPEGPPGPSRSPTRRRHEDIG